jgi:integrase
VPTAPHSANRSTLPVASRSTQPVGVVRAEQLTRLLKTCEGRDFTSRRDTAVILLLVDTGMRRADCAGMTLDDVDQDQGSSGCWARAAGRGRSRSVARPPKRSTATCGRERDIGWPICRTCGSTATGP